jgi:flavin reductase (DIM6/NTAB) family NADH-FMN oxidoreductase RutF
MARRRIEGAGRFYQHNPRVALIVTSQAGGRENAMAAAWHTAISFEPPLIGVSISPKRFTYKLILESGEFGMNFLPFEKAELIAAVGGSAGVEVDKFQRFLLKKVKTLRTSVPILADAYAAYECKLVDHKSYGDHELFVGEVVATHYQTEAVTDEGVLDLGKAAPVLYLGSDVYATAAEGSLKVLEREVYGKG